MTYDFKDLTVFSLNNPVLDAPLQLAGDDLGIGRIAIQTAPSTVHDTAADGSVMTSHMAGRNAKVEIDVQQASALHAVLRKLHKQLRVAADGGDTSNWATTVIEFQPVQGGSGYSLSGVWFDDSLRPGSSVRWFLTASKASPQ
jgi:structural protein KPP10_ORF10